MGYGKEFFAKKKALGVLESTSELLEVFLSRGSFDRDALQPNSVVPVSLNEAGNLGHPFKCR